MSLTSFGIKKIEDLFKENLDLHTYQRHIVRA